MECGYNRYATSRDLQLRFAAADKRYSHPTQGLASVALPWVGLTVMQCSNNGRSGAGEFFEGAWEALMSPSSSLQLERVVDQW